MEKGIIPYGLYSKVLREGAQMKIEGRDILTSVTLQKKNVFKYLVDIINAYRMRLPHPSLIAASR